MNVKSAIEVLNIIIIIFIIIIIIIINLIFVYRGLHTEMLTRA